MMNVKTGLVACVATLSVSLAVGQSASPTDAEIQDAIDYATKNKNGRWGLELNDGTDMLGMGPTTGFSIHVHTPLAWIYREAADRARKYQPFALANVSGEFREPVLRVTASPDMPKRVVADTVSLASSVDHVVLMDKERTRPIQPIWSEFFTVDAANAMGGKASFKGVNAKFALADLRELRGPKGDQEFLVVVVAGRQEKRFEIKKKHFERLP